MARLKSDTSAWRFQTWASFILALSATTMGILLVPSEFWVKAFLGLGLWFTVSSCFALSKTLRDNHEADKITSKIEEAKTEQILREVATNPIYQAQA